VAVYNEILTGRYNRMLQKLLSMKGSASMTSLSGELAATLSVFYGVENRYLEGWDRFGGQAVTNAVAAQNSEMRLRNPSGSNVLAVIEKITYSVNVAGAVSLFYSVSDTDLALVNVNTRLDKRGRQASSLAFSAGNNISGGIGVYTNDVQASTPFDVIQFENQEFPLLPGDQLDVRTATPNVVLRVGMIWRERALEESERA
jgi:hypothetical protein